MLHFSHWTEAARAADGSTDQRVFVVVTCHGTRRATVLILIGIRAALCCEVECSSSIVKVARVSQGVRCISVYSGTSDKGPSEIGMTSLQRTLLEAPC